jgi:hypothetical protein
LKNRKRLIIAIAIPLIRTIHMYVGNIQAGHRSINGFEPLDRMAKFNISLAKKDTPRAKKINTIKQSL